MANVVIAIEADHRLNRQWQKKGKLLQSIDAQRTQKYGTKYAGEQMLVDSTVPFCCTFLMNYAQPAFARTFNSFSYDLFKFIDRNNGSEVKNVFSIGRDELMCSTDLLSTLSVHV